MKKIQVTSPSMPTLEEYIDEIRDIWKTRWLTNMGEKHQTLQKKLGEYLEVDGVELLTNGHMALELSIQAMKINGEVITTPFTFASTTHAIVRNGLKPVFCDINVDDYTIDASKIESLITDKTSAIVPVHVYGNVCQIEEIDRIAKKYGLKVIYDAAHAFGVKYKNKGVANFGDASCFSFHATKVYNTIEGGAVCFHDRDFGRELYRLKNFGIRDQETVDGIGANAKMNEFCAAMGLCNLRHLDETLQKRKKITEIYENELNSIEGIKISKTQENVTSNYSYFPILIDEKKFGLSRNEVFNELIRKDIFARKYFYPLTNTFDCYHAQYDASETPLALYISKRILTLPLYADMSEEDANRVCQTIKMCKE